MVSRLYPSTRPLYEQVSHALLGLGVNSVFRTITLGLISLYIAGLIYLDKRQNPSRISRFFPARFHDSLNRLLSRMPWQTHKLMSLLIEWVKSRPGYLCLDDVVVEKPFSKSIPYVGWTYSTSLRRKVLGMHIVILFWSDGKYRIPISFRIWRPKKDCPKGGYKTKIDLALEIVGEAMSKGLKPQYIVFDCWYNSRRFTKALRRLGLVWVSVLKSNVRVRHRRRLRRASRLGSRLKEERKGLRVYLPRYGKVKLVIVRNGDKKEYLVTNALRASPEMVILRKSSRWDAEESFREAKQLAGLGACQSRVPQAVERHAALALLTLVVLQLLKSDPSETMGQVKERLQLQVLAGAPALTLA